MNSPEPASLSAEGNPFSTRRVRPGAIEYLFPAPISAAALVDRLRDHGWRGEIIGPHGSGKSTLLATLLPLLEQAGRTDAGSVGNASGWLAAEPKRRPSSDASGRKVVHVALHAGQRRLPISSAESRSWNHSTQIVVDGYEQLSWWSRRWLDLVCRRRGAGLLVSAHESVGLPTLLATAPTLDVVQSIVARLLPAGSTLISPGDVARCYDEHQSNIRETLFALYDLYELRRAR